MNKFFILKESHALFHAWTIGLHAREEALVTKLWFIWSCTDEPGEFHLNLHDLRGFGVRQRWFSGFLERKSDFIRSRWENGGWTLDFDLEALMRKPSENPWRGRALLGAVNDEIKRRKGW